MGTHTVYSAETARPRTRIWRILGAIVAGLMVLVIVGIGWFLSIARSALPELDGPLPVAGVSAPVSVTRDAHGVPTIESATLDDLFFAQGYVTAQDRLFQMDLMRRAATGELAEIVGDVALEHDR
ncbi:MAG: penicillin acylase family protein, partial [Acidobacteria bacterium]